LSASTPSFSQKQERWGERLADSLLFNPGAGRDPRFSGGDDADASAKFLTMTPRHVKIDDITLGNDLPLVFITGPNTLESRAHALEMSAALAELAARLKIDLIYKTSFDKANRSSIGGARGIGLAEGLPVLAEVKERTGLPVLTDVHEKEQCAPVAEVVDILQIPAFLCRQTDLLLAAGRTGKPVNVKKGQFLAPWEMKNVAAKIASTGNEQILLCERGVSFGYNTLVADMRALPIMARTGYPVVFDATHAVAQPGGLGDRSGGEREFAPILARAAVAVGIAAIFIETHPDPDRAPCEGPTMLPFKDLPQLLETLIAFDEVAKARPASIAP
jgi:2-dehydro-3-deoxyphosphooctonate aldolase (KDO 8-P synthase)